jgi:hypothetical protein
VMAPASASRSVLRMDRYCPGSRGGRNNGLVTGVEEFVEGLC